MPKKKNQANSLILSPTLNIPAWWVLKINFKNNNQKGDVTNLAIDALTKEMKYEAFAEKEELERERAA